VKSPSEPSGTPCRRLASATPQRNGAPKLDATFAPSHVARQRGLSLLFHHSNETARTIRKTRINSRRR
jgi:hypothetical protein